MQNSNVILSGRYFIPYSGFADQDRSTLACYYRKVYRENKQSGKREYPISVVMGADGFAIYWHGELNRKQPKNNKQQQIEELDIQDYSVVKIFSFTYSQAQYDSFEKWLNKDEIIYKVPEGSTDIYSFDQCLDADSDQNPIQQKSISPSLSFSQSYAYPNYSDGTGKPPRPGEEPFRISMQEFFLDLLYDLHHSNLFQSHPNYLDLIDFLNTVPLSKAIILKAQYYWANAEHQRAIFRETDPVPTPNLKKISWKIGVKILKTDGEPSEDVSFHRERMEKYRSNWLKFIRSSMSEQKIRLSPWFLGVEIEHDLVYEPVSPYSISTAGKPFLKKAKMDSSLRKEAEDSLQWLLSRYNVLGAFQFQLGKIYNLASRSIVLVTTILAIIALLVFMYFKLFGFGIFSELSIVFSFLFGVSIIFLSMLISIFLFERFIYHTSSEFIFNWRKKKPIDWNSFFDALASIPKILAIIKPKILLASGVVWTFLFASDVDALWDLNFYFGREKKIIVFFVLFFAFIFVVSRLSLYISKNRVPRTKPPIGTPYHPKKHMHCFLIFTLLILLILLIFFSIIPMWNSVSIQWSAIKIALALVLLLILFFVLDNKNREKWFVKLTSRAVFVMALATLYSFAIGLVGMSVNAKKEMTKQEQIEVYKNLYKEDKLGFRDTFNMYFFKKDTGFLSELRTYLPDSLKKESPSFDDVHSIYAKESRFKKVFIQHADDYFANKDHHETILKEVYEKILPKLRHEHTNELVCFRLELPYAKEISQDKAALFALIHPLIFFTFISVAIGLLLEMGLRIEDTGIDFG